MRPLTREELLAAEDGNPWAEPISRKRVLALLAERDELREKFGDVERLVVFLDDAIKSGAGCCEAERGARVTQIREHIARVKRPDWVATFEARLAEAWTERDELAKRLEGAQTELGELDAELIVTRSHLETALADAARLRLEAVHPLMQLAQRVASASEPKLLKYADAARDLLATITVDEVLKPGSAAEWLEAKLSEVRRQTEAEINAEWRDIQEGRQSDSVDRHDAEVRRRALEEAAQLVLGGSFLHDQAPTAQFAREVAAMLGRHSSALAAEPPRKTEGATLENTEAVEPLPKRGRK